LSRSARTFSRAIRKARYATFEDGYQSACIVDAILASHTRGGVWTKVEAR